MSITYIGATLGIVAGAPATYDQAGYEAQSHVTGTCALQSVPNIVRQWATVTEELVCQDASFDKKGVAKYAPVTFKLSKLEGDTAQDVYETLEADRSGIGSFALFLPTVGTVYFTAMVSMFSLVAGGTANDIHGADVELLIQVVPTFVAV